MKTIVQIECKDETEAKSLIACVNKAMESFQQDGSRPGDFWKGFTVDRVARAVSVRALDDGKDQQ